MIEDLILRQPKDIRDKCKVTDSKIIIPKSLRRTEIQGDLKPHLEEEGPNIGKALYETVDLKKPKLKDIFTLLNTKGR